MRFYLIALNHIRRRKLKMSFVFLGILIGITAMVSLSSLVQAIDKELADKFDQIGSNIMIIPKSEDLSLSYGSVQISGAVKSEELPEESIKKIYDIEEANAIALTAPKVLGSAEILFDGSPKSKAVLMGVNWEEEMRLKRWWQIDGNVGMQPKSVVLGSRLAQRHGLALGDRLRIGPQDYTVTGILQDMGTMEDEMVLMPLAEAQEVLDMNGRLSMIEVAALCYSCPIDMIVAQISEKLPDARVLAIRETIEARSIMVDRFSSGARIVLIIVLSISMFIIVNTIMAAVSQRTGEIGILRAIGYRKKHIVSIILMEIAAISLAAGVIGFLLGSSIAFFSAPLLADMDVSTQWQPMLLLQAVMTALLMGMIAGLWPAMKASRLDPALALRYF